MAKKEFRKKAAPVLIIALLMIELFFPFAYANSQTPSIEEKKERIFFQESRETSGYCQLDDALSNPNERERFWDHIIGLGFQAEQMAALTDTQIRDTKREIGKVTTTTEDLLSPEWNKVKVSAQYLSVVSGISMEEIKKDLGIKEDEDISILLVNSYLSKKLNPNKAVEILEKLGLTSKKTVVELPAYCNYKVKLYDEVEGNLCEWLNKPEFTEKMECMLNGTHIEGRVSYMALLDDDIILCNARSSTCISEKKDENILSKSAQVVKNMLQMNNAYEDNTIIKQYISGDSVTAQLNNLDSGGSVVIPDHYLKMISFLKTWLWYETLINGLEAAYAFMDITKSKRLIEEYRELNNVRINMRQTVDQEAMAAVDKNPLKKQMSELLNKPPSTPEEMERFIDFVRRQRSEFPSEDAHQAVIRRLEEIRDAPDVKAAFNEKSEGLLTGLGFSGPEQAAAQNWAQQVKYQNRMTEIEKEFGGSEGKIPTEAGLFPKQKILSIIEGKFNNNFVFGFLWLGPGRAALELANNFIFWTLKGEYKDSYIKLYAAKAPPKINVFREATNWIMSGNVVDLVSDLTKKGIPRQTYEIGPIYIINNPLSGSEESITSIRYDESKINIDTDWKGSSEATFFEDIRTREDYARMHVYTNSTQIDLNLVRKKELELYYKSLMIIAPILSWKIVPVMEGTLSLGIRLIAADFYINKVVDPSLMNKAEICNDKEIEKWMYFYEIAAVSSQAQNLLMFPGVYKFFSGRMAYLDRILMRMMPESGLAEKSYSGLKSYFGGKAGQTFSKIINLIQPIELGKMYIASMGQQYVSTCKDTGYTILAYQVLEKNKNVEAIINKTKPVEDFMGSLALKSILEGIGSKITKSDLKEILNVRSAVSSQFGKITPNALFYLHLDKATIQKIGIAKLLKMDKESPCWGVKETFERSDKAITAGPEGLESIDKLTGEKIKLADGLRALMLQTKLDKGRALVPNKLIKTKLDCGKDKEILEIGVSRDLIVKDNSCNAINCLKRLIKEVTGKEVKNDLSEVLGKVTSVYTSEGFASFKDGLLRFIKINPRIGEQKEIQIPSITAEDALLESKGTELFKASKIEVMGDGRVVLKGYNNSKTIGTQEVGILDTIFFEKGKAILIYDSETNELTLGIIVLAQEPISSVKEVTTKPSTARDEKGNNVPAFNINIIPAPGKQESAQELQRAIELIQRDKATGGPGGIRSVETPNYQVVLDTNDKGEPTLKVIDRKTGDVVKEYTLTGAAKNTAPNEIQYQTKDGGTVNLFTGMKDGKLASTITGSDGYRMSEPITALRGAQGMIAVDPHYINTFNAQDIPLNPEFMKKGMSWLSDGEVTKGVPAANLFDPPRNRNEQPQYNALLSLPGEYPLTEYVGIISITIIVVGVLVIRASANKKRKK